MPVVDLELFIRPGGGSYLADARLTQPGSQADALIARDAPASIDPAPLLVLDAEDYGQALTAQLFPDPGPLRDAWRTARGVADGAALPLRLRLRLGDATLQSLRWETLRDPLTAAPLACDAQLRLVRYLDSADTRPISSGPRPELHALVVVANPRDLHQYGLSEIDVEGEVGRTRHALGDIQPTIIGDHAQAAERRATLAALRSTLRRERPTLLCLICHGTHDGTTTTLWLENEQGNTERVPAEELCEVIAQSDHPPLLAVLIACQSGGQSHSAGTLAALGPRLAQAGVGAVLAMQARLSTNAARRFLPVLFEELARDGQIDRAVALARATLRDGDEWWVPALWLRLRDGQLWDSELEAQPTVVTPVTLKAPPPPTPRPLRGSPFTPGTVAPPERFFGRAYEIDAILSSVQSMQSISIVGEARIGKSSLLRFLEAQLPDLLADYGRYRPIYLSMDRLRDPSAFYAALLAGLLPSMPAGAADEYALRRLDAALSRGEAPTAETTERVIGWAASAGLQVVLLLDEFKELVERPAQFDPLFCGWLRSLYTQRQLALVMATRQPLPEIEQLSLYFLNGLSGTYTLGPLHAADAEALLLQPHDRPFSDAEVRIGLYAGDDHPYRLQVAGDRLYRWKGQRPGPIHEADGSLREAADRTLRRDVQAAFDTVQALSSPRPVRRSWWRWVDGLGSAGSKLGDSADQAGNRVLGVVILLGVLVLGGALLALVSGLIDLQTFRDLLRAISGGGS